MRAEMRRRSVPPEREASDELGLRERLGRCPEGVAKGFLFETALRGLTPRPPAARARYQHFFDYPVDEWISILPLAARARFPRVSAEEGMRRIGREVHGQFLETAIGRTIFGIVGARPETLVSLAPRAYRATRAHGKSIAVRDVTHGRAVVELRGFYDWIESFHAGMFEGAMELVGISGSVRAHMYTPYDGDLELRWLAGG